MCFSEFVILYTKGKGKVHYPHLYVYQAQSYSIYFFASEAFYSTE